MAADAAGRFSCKRPKLLPATEGALPLHSKQVHYLLRTTARLSTALQSFHFQISSWIVLARGCCVSEPFCSAGLLCNAHWQSISGGWIAMLAERMSRAPMSRQVSCGNSSEMMKHGVVQRAVRARFALLAERLAASAQRMISDQQFFIASVLLKQAVRLAHVPSAAHLAWLLLGRFYKQRSAC
jgi:hypothetical protein